MSSDQHGGAPFVRKAGLVALLLLTQILGTASAQVYEKFFSFTNANVALPSGTGAFPNGLVLGSDGNYYGTAQGGPDGYGTVFRMTPAGVVTVLVNFSNTGSQENRGAIPLGTLIEDDDGNFYGTTSFGGANNDGTIFRVTSIGIITTLVDFTGNGATNRGANPRAGLTLGRDGNFYGTTPLGGVNNDGTVFKMTPAGVLTTLVDFTGLGPQQNRGAIPSANLIQGFDGNFYGTTFMGGATGNGTVFKMAPDGTLTTLVDFTGSDVSTDPYRGAFPQAGLIEGSDGTFYGTTSNGGKGYGTVFQITFAGVASTLVDFTGSGVSTDPYRGATPLGDLIQGSDGNFYGTTSNGGLYTFGTVFRMTVTGGVATLNTLVDFTDNGTTNRGAYPQAALIQGTNGNFFGTANHGGAYGSGTVFQMTTAGVLTTLADFTGAGATLGSDPDGLIRGSDGNFYGTVDGGGANGFGAVFRMTPAAVVTLLVSFTANGTSNRGAAPTSGLLQASDGNFYGTTAESGANDDGTVFKMIPAGALTTLVDFTGTSGANPGYLPHCTLIQGSDGNFYGTTELGGANGQGNVFKMTPAGVLTSLVSFTGSGVAGDPYRGQYPQCGLVQGSDGNYYGTTANGGVNGDGTVFKMTPAGVLSTLVDFTGNGTTNRGGYPQAALIQGKDGNFYGTTSSGGVYGYGTVFKMTSAGVLTTLVDFTGDGASNIGSDSTQALFQASDGNFYGTTQQGGANGSGTVFQMTPAGVLNTLHDFADDPVDNVPNAPLIQGSDGNLYGTTQGTGTGSSIEGDGAIYRLIFAGAPLVYVNAPTPSTTSIVFALSANARGLPTSVSLVYDTVAANLASDTPIPLSVNLNGYVTTPLGTTLSNLTPGITYYYQVIATNSNGTTKTPVASFSTFEAPTAETTGATGLSQSSEQLSGTVDAFNYSASVVFQYSADGGQTFPYSLPATTPVGGSVAGTGATTVSATISNSQSTPLAAGTIYSYRIVATSVCGTTVSGVQSFTTLTSPMAVATAASFVDSQSAQLNGTVNALGAATTVTFVYGTESNGVFTALNTVPATTPTGGTVNGTGNVAVSATISSSTSVPLVQGTTYYYEVEALSAGSLNNTPTVSAPVAFSLQILSGLGQLFPTVPVAGTGSLQINLLPATTGSFSPGWRLVGEQLWRASGATATGLIVGQDYQVEYEPAGGYLPPPQETVSIASGSTTVLSRIYYPTPSAGTGSLTVVLQPANLTGAQWRLYGANNPWYSSGHTLSNLIPGIYLVECEPVANQTTPPPSSVQVTSGSTVAQLTYQAANTANGAAPAPLTFAQITDSTTQGKTMPYAYVGQIRSDVGASTGFVVTQHVVATAAHVVFNDGLVGSGQISYATGQQWLFERQASVYEPVPQTPRGALVLSSYSADRLIDATPGVESTTSQNQDVAALYFFDNAGGANGGYGGYLASGAAVNEYLDSNDDKMLVGYPVDQLTTGSPGEMFATAPITSAFNQLLDGGGNPLQVYTTTGLYSFGGNSGGPLCVQYNGIYYPAAIYLGGSQQTVVRAIDGNVTALFAQAEYNGQNSVNNTGGGSTLVNTTLSANILDPSLLQVNFTAGAPSGAGWALGPIGSTYTAHAGGMNLQGLPSGPVTIYYAAVPYFLTPANYAVTLIGGTQSTVTTTYEGISTQPTNVTSAAGGSATYSVSTTGAPTAYQWQYSSDGTTYHAITNATAATYTLSNLTSANAGDYEVVVTWGTDGSITSAPATLAISGTQTYTFAQWTGLYPALSNTAQSATPQNDGVTNLMKYLFDINPTQPMTQSDLAALPVLGTTTISNQTYLTLTYRQYQYLSSSATITVQTAASLTNNSWTTPTGATIIATGATVTGDTPPGGTAATDPIMQARVPLTTPARQFIRLEITSP